MLFSGILRQPKWGHLKDLHAAIKLCEPALIAVDGSPQYVKLGSMQEVCSHFLTFGFINFVQAFYYLFRGKWHLLSCNFARGLILVLLL